MIWRSRARRIAQAVLPGAVLPLFLSACGQLLFFAANLPVLQQPRQANLRFMEGPRGFLDFYPPPKAKHAAGQGGAAAPAAAAPAAGAPAAAAPAAAALPPIVLFWYGGSFEKGSKSSYRFVGAAFAKLGYPTLLPDYRLYPQRFPVYIEDAARAVAWAQQHAAELGGDARRIVLAGHSAGAYIAAMLALNPQYLRAAGVDPRAIVGLVGLSGPYGLLPTSAPLNIAFSAPYTPEQWQPLRFVSADDPPALLAHGLDDDVVYASHTERLAAALQAAGVPVKLLLYPKHGHADTIAALSVPARGRLPVLTEIDAFLKSGLRAN